MFENCPVGPHLCALDGEQVQGHVGEEWPALTTTRQALRAWFEAECIDVWVRIDDDDLDAIIAIVKAEGRPPSPSHLDWCGWRECGDPAHDPPPNGDPS